MYSASAKIVREMHVHKPESRLIMCYTNTENVLISHLINPKRDDSMTFVVRTLRWAAINGIQVVFKPA